MDEVLGEEEVEEDDYVLVGGDPGQSLPKDSIPEKFQGQTNKNSAHLPASLQQNRIDPVTVHVKNNGFSCTH